MQPYTGKIITIGEPEEPVVEEEAPAREYKPYTGKVLEVDPLPPPDAAAKPVVYEGNKASTPAGFPAVDEATRIERDAERLRLLLEERKLAPSDTGLAQDISNEQFGKGTVAAPPGETSIPVALEERVYVPYTGKVISDPVAAPAAPAVEEEPYSIEGEFAKGAAQYNPEEPGLAGVRWGKDAGVIAEAAPMAVGQVWPAAKGWFARRMLSDLTERGVGESELAKSYAADAAAAGAEYGAGQMELAELLKEKGFGSDVALSASASFLMNMPGLAASIATRNPLPALAGAFASSKFLAEQEALRQGATPENAAMAGQLHGAAEALFEIGPMGLVMKAVGKEGVKNFFMKYFVAENLTEIPTTITQDLVDWALVNPEKSFQDFLKETGYNVAVTAAATPISAGAMTGVTAPIHTAIRNKEMKAQEAAIQDLLRVFGDSVPPPPGTTPAVPGVPPIVAGPSLAQDTQELLDAAMADAATRTYTPEQIAAEKVAQAGAFLDVPGTEYGAGVGGALARVFGTSADVGNSPAVEARRAEDRYVDAREANAAVPPDQWVVVANGREPTSVGHQVRHISSIADGTVLGLGGDLFATETLFPEETMKGVVEGVQKIADKVGITAPIFITAQQLEGGQTSGHTTIALPDGRMAHVINPRELPSGRAAYKGGNANAALDFIYSMTHEVGHALVTDKLAQGMADRYIGQFGGDQTAVRSQMNAIVQSVFEGTITPEAIQQLAQTAPTEAALFGHWQQLRERAMTGNITAKEWVDQWLGVRKFALGSQNKGASTASRYDWIEARAREIGINKRIDDMTVDEAIRAVHQNPDGTPDYKYVLNFQEFSAEQFSRAAHDRNYLKGTMLGNWYQAAIQRLREFFRMAKDQGFIAPSKQFNDWLDERERASNQLKRGRWWGHTKLGKEAKEIQRQRMAEQLAQEQAEEEALEVAGEQELQQDLDDEEGPVYEPPEEETVAAMEAVANTETLYNTLVAAGFITSPIVKTRISEALAEGEETAALAMMDKSMQRVEADRKKAGLPHSLIFDTVRDLLSTNDVAEAQEAILDYLQDKQSWNFDKQNTYTSTLLEKLYNMDRLGLLADGKLTQMQMRQLRNSPGLKQQDKLALQAMLEKQPVGMYALADIYEQVVNQNVELLVAESNVLAKLGTDAFLNGMKSGGYVPGTFKMNLASPLAPNLTTHNHFDDDRNVMHARAAINQLEGVMKMYELQSDLIQWSSEGAKQLQIARLQKVIETYNEWMTNLSDDMTFYSQRISEQTDRDMIKGLLAQYREAQNSFDEYHMQREQYKRALESFNWLHAEDGGKKTLASIVNSLRNSDWWMRGFREMMKYASQNDLKYVDLIAGKDLPKAQDWVPKLAPNQEWELSAPQEIRSGYDKLGPFTKVAIDASGDYRVWVPDRNDWDFLISQDLHDAMSYWLYAESGLNPAHLGFEGGQQRLMDRYDQHIIPWLVKTYNAKEIWDENTQSTFYRVDLAEAKSDTLWLWDKGNPVSDATSRVGQVLTTLSDGKDAAWHITMNSLGRVSDAFVQLHQRAAQPLADGTPDLPMRSMVQSARQGEAYKNSMQQPANVLIKELEKRSEKELKQMYDFLDNEWKSGVSAFDLQGWDAPPNAPDREQIWGTMPDGGGEFSQKVGFQVKYWTLVPKPDAVREGMKKVGINAESQKGIELVHLMMQMKQVYLDQFTNLQRDLTQKIVQRFGLGAIGWKEQAKLYQIMQKIRLEPFFPQGHYGKYAVVVETKKTNPAPKERKWATTRIEYFESKWEQQKAARAWKAKAAASNGKLRAKPKELQEYDGIPLQLPRNLLTQLENTGLYDEKQLATMSEMMVPLGQEKIGQRYDTWNDKTEGGQRDLLRNFANFAWHNSNFIWKLRFRGEFTKAMNAQNSLVRKASIRNDEMGAKLYDELSRNTAIMERTKDYLLYPPYEFQTLRGVAALTYLAANPLTALMNITTYANTLASLNQQFGVTLGGEIMAKATWASGAIFSLPKDPDTANVRADKVTAENSEWVWLYNRATQEGVIDASYSFFLAGQANQATFLRPIRQGAVRKIGYYAGEVGMFPFRMAEKALRLTTLNAWFLAERQRGLGMEEAYAEAVQKVDQLQGAYDQANRSEMFRGKKAILFMFAGFMQMMLWNMGGGYGKATSANLAYRQQLALARGNQALADKLVAAYPTGAYSLQLWMLYMLLGGLFAGPGMENLKEVLKYFYRLLFKKDMMTDLRNFVKEIGGGGHWYNNPDLLEGGVLNDFFGYDLSSRVSLGRVIPFMDMLNRDAKDPEAWLGSAAVKTSGPFGGFTTAVIEMVATGIKWAKGEARGTEILAKMPGMIGYIGKSLDAWILQGLQPGEGAGVINKQGVRMTEDPVGSGNFRDLTNAELVGMALGLQPTFVARSREAAFAIMSEQVYWNTRIGVLLDARFNAIATGDDKRLEQIDRAIDKFNDSLPEGYESLMITGKVMRKSLESKRQNVDKKEFDRFDKRMQGPLLDTADAYNKE